MGSSGLWIFLFSVLLSPWISWGNSELTTQSSLSVRQRDSLRYHLENFYNEMDLLIRNEKVDYFDLQRQERDLATLKVFERIPFKPALAELREALTKSANASGLRLTHFKVEHSVTSAPPVPAYIYTNSSFHFRDDQLVERIQFVMRVQGRDVQKWGNSLPHSQVRYVKVDRIDPLGKSFRISAHAFRFRNVRFPQLKPKDPLTYLPSWAQKRPAQFAEAEPTLWMFVKRIETLSPKTPPLYEARGKFLLNDARLNFFIHLTQRI